ncbi:MAG: methyltransferase domain-containing protein, partial [Myxococcota bacterium]|nr:methyltransferase domain-containing protein [Myxococcota bacterium]
TFIRTLRDAPDSSPRVQAAADAITNRETWFFRDHAQLERVVAAAGERCARQGAQSLRVLSAGCATGEEPLSVAMLALDAPHLFLGAAVEVTGFDVSPFALEQARGGQFRVTDLRRAESGPAGWEGRFFRQEDSRLVARSWLSGRVKFELHNLLGDPSRFEAGGFDLVLCRNVLIYFDQEAATRALNALCGWVRPGGQLVLGTAEAGLLTDPRLTRTPVAGAFLREDVR